MIEKLQHMEIRFDFLPNQPHNDETRKLFRQILSQEFERNLPDAVERIWKLPPFALKPPFGIYSDLLVEARNLFLAGHFYSCVAMCGIVGERIIKDKLRASVVVKKGDKTQSPEGKAFDQFERVDVSSIARFLSSADILTYIPHFQSIP